MNPSHGVEQRRERDPTTVWCRDQSEGNCHDVVTTDVKTRVAALSRQGHGLTGSNGQRSRTLPTV
jgi:hypothetical protein